VVSYSQFRVTRNSDLWVDEEEVKNLRQALQSELHSRNYGFAVRLEVARGCPRHLADFLLDQFSIERSRLFSVDGPVNMGRLLEIVNSNARPELKFAPFVPGFPAKLVNHHDIFAVLDRQDVLLHHPFQSFEPVIDFIRSAASDPNVVAIKQTIYRAGANSELMEALINAAVRGKEVTVIVELMARFDEEANINWAERLEEAGAQVVYGVVGLKTHAKLALVLRREPQGLRRYAHLGTGNYNPTTAKHYTDFGLLTSSEELTADVNEVFIHLTSMTRPTQLSSIWLAPFSLQKEVVKAIRQEAAIAREGKPARIIAKMNSLTDESVIRALYDASNDGVRIDLIVRGACALRPGVPGLSENIRVRSIVGRFLEHSRIFYFRNKLQHDVYLSSADWMNRNLFRRVEIAFPVRSPALKKRVIREGLQVYLKDNVNAWELGSDGHYRRRKPRGSQAPYSAQLQLMESLGMGSSRINIKELRITSMELILWRHAEAEAAQAGRAGRPAARADVRRARATPRASAPGSTASCPRSAGSCPAPPRAACRRPRRWAASSIPSTRLTQTRRRRRSWKRAAGRTRARRWSSSATTRCWARWLR
jgi:polyphosphate kinase